MWRYNHLHDISGEKLWLVDDDYYFVEISWEYHGRRIYLHNIYPRISHAVPKLCQWVARLRVLAIYYMVIFRDSYDPLYMGTLETSQYFNDTKKKDIAQLSSV